MPQSRNRAFGIVTLAAVIGGVMFLLITPAVERNAHVAVVESGDIDQLESSLRHLCWIRSGVERLNERVPTLDFQRKRDVLAAADSLGCIGELSPELQATHDLVSGTVGHAIGFEDDTIEPAIEALREGNAEVREHASKAIVALRDRLSITQRAQVESIADNMPASPARARLIVQLELSITTPAAMPPPVAQPDMGTGEAQPDMGSSEGKEEPSADAGLRPRSQPRLIEPLREPTFEIDTSGVLFRADGPADQRVDEPANEPTAPKAKEAVARPTSEQPTGGAEGTAEDGAKSAAEEPPADAEPAGGDDD